jgi:hypothetical protein
MELSRRHISTDATNVGSTAQRPIQAVGHDAPDQQHHRTLSGCGWFLTGWTLYRELYAATLRWIACAPELFASGARDQGKWRIEDGC